MAIMAGTTALVARAIGSGDAHEAAQVTRASMGLCLLISFFTVILLWIGADYMIGLFGLDEASEVTVYPQFSEDGGMESERTYVKQLVQKYISDGSSDDLFNEDEIENANGDMS